MIGKLVRVAAWSLLAVVAVVVFVSLTLLVLLAAGMPAPPKLYLLLGDHFDEVAPASSFEKVDAQVISPSLEKSRNIAFEMLNIRPEARLWMSRIQLERSEDAQYSGWYAPSERRLVIIQPYVQVFLHEFAHVNFDRKPIWERCLFAINVIRLYFDGEEQAAYRSVLLQTLALAVAYAERGQVIDLFQEIYAFIAQASRGNLAVIPEYLQPFYADYLQPGENSWSRWLKAGSNS